MRACDAAEREERGAAITQLHTREKKMRDCVHLSDLILAGAGQSSSESRNQQSHRPQISGTETSK